MLAIFTCGKEKSRLHRWAYKLVYLYKRAIKGSEKRRVNLRDDLKTSYKLLRKSYTYMQYFFHVLSIHYIGILSKNLCTCTFLRKVIIYKYSLMSSTIICMRVNVMYEGLQHIHRENESISGSGRL